MFDYPEAAMLERPHGQNKERYTKMPKKCDMLQLPAVQVLPDQTPDTSVKKPLRQSFVPSHSINAASWKIPARTESSWSWVHVPEEQ